MLPFHVTQGDGQLTIPKLMAKSQILKVFFLFIFYAMNMTFDLKSNCSIGISDPKNI